MDTLNPHQRRHQSQNRGQEDIKPGKPREGQGHGCQGYQDLSAYCPIVQPGCDLSQGSRARQGREVRYGGHEDHYDQRPEQAPLIRAHQVFYCRRAALPLGSYGLEGNQGEYSVGHVHPGYGYKKLLPGGRRPKSDSHRGHRL